MDINELRERFNSDVEVINRLVGLLRSDNVDYDYEVIAASIRKVREEQAILSRMMRKQMYKNLSKKSINSLMKTNKEEDKSYLLYEPTKRIPIKEVQKVVFESARVHFDGNKYILYFNNDKDSYEYGIMFDNEKAVTYDYNIIGLLKEFDLKNNTELYDKYMSAKLPVTYNFNNVGKDKRIKNIKKIALSGKKYYDNISITDNRKKKLRTLITVASLSIVSLLGVTHFPNKNKSNIAPTEIESTMEAVTTEKTKKVVTTEITTTEEITTEFYKEEKGVEVKEEVKDTKLDKEENIEVIPSVEDYDLEKSTNIGDIVNLDYVDLYYASTDNDPRGNSSYLTSNRYKIGLISVVLDNRVVGYYDTMNSSLENIKEEFSIRYGDRVKVFVNLDLLDENDDTLIKYVGWVDSDDLYKNTKVKIK